MRHLSGLCALGGHLRQQNEPEERHHGHEHHPQLRRHDGEHDELYRDPERPRLRQQPAMPHVLDVPRETLPEGLLVERRLDEVRHRERQERHDDKIFEEGLLRGGPKPGVAAEQDGVQSCGCRTGETLARRYGEPPRPRHSKTLTYRCTSLPE